MNKKRILLFCISILASIGVAHYFVVNKGMKTIKYSETRHLMGTLVNADICIASNEEQKIKGALESVWKRMDEIAAQMSVFKDSSLISEINNSEGSPIVIDQDLYHLIKDSIKYSKITQGAFDITVYPLIELWKDRAKQGRVPSALEIEDTRKSVGIKFIKIFEGNQIQLLKQKAKIDLGAIAKGYAVDEAARILREKGIKNFFIDAGGDLYVSGLNCREKPWKIGIRDPWNKNDIIEIIELVDAAVTTSGDYEQFYRIEGKKFSHIIDPLTGYPQQGIVSATVIAPTATQADALSTALCVLGEKKGTKVIDRLGKGYASLILRPDKELSLRRIESKDYAKYRLNIKD